MTRRLIDRVHQRRLVPDHDGRSGATLERGVLDDGTRVFLKTTHVPTDAAQLLTGDARRELRLWRDGIFERLPGRLGSALIGVDDFGDRLVTVTRDLGGAVLGWDAQLTLTELRTIFAAVTSLHRSFAGLAPAGLCPLETRLAMFSPAHVDLISAANPELAHAVERGHELLADLAPPDVVDAIHRCYRDPTPLSVALAVGGPPTLLHGDFFLVNVAVVDDRVVPLDWGLATAGPSAIDLLTFCLAATSNVEIDRAALLDEARAACRDLVDDKAFSAGLVWALMELGWNKPLDAIDHPDAAQRAIGRADLDFWVGHARAALDAGVLPTGEHVVGGGTSCAIGGRTSGARDTSDRGPVA